MALALDIVALLLVLAFVWAGMVWLSAYVHRNRHRIPAASGECGACDGLGARPGPDGGLVPCPTCQGTGIAIED